MARNRAILIGGGMVFTFFKAMGGNIGNSLCEDDKLELALQLIEKAKLVRRGAGGGNGISRHRVRRYRRRGEAAVLDHRARDRA